MASSRRSRSALAMGACLLALSGWQAESVRLRDLPVTSGEPYKFFMAHHKTGTALINHICDHMRQSVTGEPDLCARCQHIINASEAGTWCVRVWSNGIAKNKTSYYYPPSERFFGAVPLREVIKKAGKNYRVVHVVRDPLATFASAFIYDQKGVDHTGAGKKELEGLSLKDGLRLKAKDVRFLTEEILADHEVAVEHPQVLEVRYEDFKSNYDATVTKIFNFMMDGGHEDKIPQFVSLASKDDQARWHPARMNQNHVSDPKEEQKVVAALRELCAEGDAAVTTALRPRAGLGYGADCPGPAAA